MKPSKPRSAARHLIWPSAAILLGMSLVPLCMLVFFSFADGNVSTLNGVAGYTVRNIVEAVTSLTVRGLMLKSFWTALLVTAICIVIAYPAAWAIAKIVPEKYRSTLIMVSIVPAFTSQLLLIYSIMTLMQTNGLVMTPLLKLGILPAGTSLMYTNGSVILILVYEYLPYMILSLYSCLEKIDNNVIAASHSLGANHFQTFISVVLPQSFSGLMTGILIVLIPVAGSFVEPNIAGGPYSMMIGSLIDSQFTTSMNMGYGAALSLLFLVVMSLTLAVIRLVMNIADKRIGG